jgi:hypothetical protein
MAKTSNLNPAGAVTGDEDLAVNQNGSKRMKLSAVLAAARAPIDPQLAAHRAELDGIADAALHTFYITRTLPYALAISASLIVAGGVAVLPPAPPTNIPAPMVGVAGNRAIFDRDEAAGLRWFLDRQYPSEAAFLKATGGVKTGEAIVYGPFEEPAQVNAVTNNALADTIGWNGLNGSVLAPGAGAEAGSLKITAPGNAAAGAYFTITASQFECYRFSVDVKRGTGAVAIRAAAGITTTLAYESSSNATAAYQEKTVYAAAVHNPLLVGVEIPGTPAGDYYLRNPRAFKIRPLKGWVQNDYTSIHRMPPAGAHAGEKVLWQADADTDRDRHRIVRDGATGKVFIVSTGDGLEYARIDLGVAADNEIIAVAVRWKTQGITGSLNGGPWKTQAGSRRVAGVFKMREGIGLTVGNAYGALPGRTAIITPGEPDDALQLRSAEIRGQLPWHGIGDSGLAGAPVGAGYVAGVSNGAVVSLAADLRIATGRPLISNAVGGSIRADQRAVLFARPHLRHLPTLFANYGPGGEAGFDEQMALIDEQIAWLGHNHWLWARGIAVDNAPADLVALQVQLMNAVIAKYGAVHVWDWLPIMVARSSGSPADEAAIAAGKPPSSILPDTTHFEQGTSTALAVDGAPRMSAVLALPYQ